MKRPVSEALRELVNDYYHGLLTFESYREQRRRFFDGLADGAIDTPEEDMPTARLPKPAFATDADVSPAAGHDTPAAPESEPGAPDVDVPQPQGGSSRKVLWIAAAAGAVVAVAAGITFVTRSGDGPQARPSAVADEVPAAAPVVPLPAGQALVERFLARNDWSREETGALADQWFVMTEAERQVGRGSTAYSQLSAALQRRLREEEALSGIDGAELLALLEFAERMEFPFAANLRARIQAEADPSSAARDTAVAEPVEPEVNVEVAAPRSPPPSVADADPPAAAQTIEPAATSPAADATPVPPPAAEPEVAQETTQETTQEADEGAVAGAGTDPCRAELAETRRPYCQDTLASGAAGPPMVVLRPGRFTMGSELDPSETPAHAVTIAASFALSLYEVSVTEFRDFCTQTARACPNAAWDGDDYPMTNVSWGDAVAYSEWLSSETGFRYALPSEAQWEYAARAGTDTPYPFGDEITPAAAHWSGVARLESPASRTDSSVNRNAFRLFHMAGNVREWVADAWHDDYVSAPADGSVWSGGDEARRVVRGGSFVDPADSLRSAARQGLAAGQRDETTGFRVMRQVAE